MPRSHTTALAIPVCIVMAIGCALPRSAPRDAEQTAPPAVAAAVHARFDSLAAAIRRLDVERMLQFYAQDSAVVRAIDAQLIPGRPLVERTFREGFADIRSVDRLSFPERHLSILGPAAAVLTVRVEEAYTDRAGIRTALRGTWTSVWQLRNGEWRIVQDAAVHVRVPEDRSGKPPAPDA